VSRAAGGRYELWHRKASRALALLLLVAMVPAYAASFRKVWRQGSDRASWTRDQREFAGYAAADVDPALLVAARRAIPPGATYVLVVGRRGISAQAALEAGPFSEYALLPRRRVDAVRDAGWVIGYGADVRAAGAPVERVTTVAPNISFAQVAR